MKTYPLVAACLILVGCGQQEQSNREVLGKLETIKTDLATRRAETVRWAFANKREIESAVFQSSRDKTEALAPEVEQKVRQYEVLQTQLTQKEMEARGFRLPPRAGRFEGSAPDESYEALSNRVAAARAPIADVLERRSRQTSQYVAQFSAEKLIAEYVKGRFDLVVDSSDEHMSRSPVLYRTNGEVLDITDGVIKLLKDKTKP